MFEFIQKGEVIPQKIFQFIVVLRKESSDTETQIKSILKKAEPGVSVSGLRRKIPLLGKPIEQDIMSLTSL